MTSSKQSRHGINHTQLSKLAAAVCLIGLALTGCSSSPAASELQALEAQHDAKRVEEEALLRAAKKSAVAEGKANTAVAAAYNDARRTTDKSQAKAAVAAEEAHEDIVDARDDLREWAGSHLQAIDDDISKARMEATGKGLRAQAAFTATMVEVDAQRTALQVELGTLDARMAKDWAGFKSGFEARMSALETRIKETRARI